MIPQAALVSDHDSFKEFLVEAGGATWRIARLADLDTLWDRLADTDDPDDVYDDEHYYETRRRSLFEEDERLPYWTELWPSSYLLAEWLVSQASHIEGRRCLDMGCGLGFTALVGCRLGARVTAMDYELEALEFARRNEARNRVHLGGNTPAWLCMDWRHPAFRKGRFEIVWAGDVVYEQRFIAPVADFLERVLAPGGTAWVAEPDRAVYTPFITAMQQRGFTATKAWHGAVKAHNWPDGGVPASLWEFRRAG